MAKTSTKKAARTKRPYNQKTNPVTTEQVMRAELPALAQKITESDMRFAESRAGHQCGSLPYEALTLQNNHLRNRISGLEGIIANGMVNVSNLRSTGICGEQIGLSPGYANKAIALDYSHKQAISNLGDHRRPFGDDSPHPLEPRSATQIACEDTGPPVMTLDMGLNHLCKNLGHLESTIERLLERLGAVLVQEKTCAPGATNCIEPNLPPALQRLEDSNSKLGHLTATLMSVERRIAL